MLITPTCSLINHLTDSIISVTTSSYGYIWWLAHSLQGSYEQTNKIHFLKCRCNTSVTAITTHVNIRSFHFLLHYIYTYMLCRQVIKIIKSFFFFFYKVVIFLHIQSNLYIKDTPKEPENVPFISIYLLYTG